jgi:DNA-binding GntR family transcriptional regulator
MKNSFPLPSLNHLEVLPDKIYSSLEGAILQGRIKPGDRLIEDELSRSLGVSRGPIREAFRLLEKDGLIRRVPRKGAIVESISKEDISEIYEVIGILEGLAAKLFCKKATDDELARLKQIYEEMERQVKKDHFVKCQRLNSEFHGVIINGCHNKKIKEIYENFQKQIHWFQKITLSYMGRPEISLEEHKNMLKALLKRDAERAEVVAREHIERATATYLRRPESRG